MAHAPSTDVHDANAYFVPHGSRWPVIASVALFATMVGFASWLNEASGGKPLFFAAFFGALFYARQYSMSWLNGQGDGVMTNTLLWPGFASGWPSNGPGDIGGTFQTIPAWGLPLLNTLILLTSGVTVTIAHHALKAGHRKQLLVFLGLTVLLGATFLYFQAEEYIHAYTELNLTLGSGIYGSTFFMLTGFHGAHVTLGTIMLLVIWFRCLKGHFTGEDHFAFEAVAWYWHFVDVVWLGLFLFVYVL